MGHGKMGQWGHLTGVWRRRIEGPMSWRKLPKWPNPRGRWVKTLRFRRDDRLAQDHRALARAWWIVGAQYI
jgi:hypothetical protein